MRRLLIVSVAVFASFAVACGGSDADTMSLEEYLTAFDEAGDVADAESEELSYDAITADQSFEERRDSFVETSEQYQAVFEDYLAELETLDPPAEAQEPHQQVIDAFGAYSAAFEDIIEDARASESEQDFEENVDLSGLDDTSELDTLCDEMQSLADDNEIDVDLECDAE